MQTFKELEKIIKYHNFGIDHASDLMRKLVWEDPSIMKITDELTKTNPEMMLVPHPHTSTFGLCRKYKKDFIDYATFDIDGVKINEEHIDEFPELKELILKAEEILSKFMKKGEKC
ncbi:hypothetical protein [Sulfurimonas sp.]|uniref:hypothetical protein n=1 Tax=Sulfurimonas sp. TaxID=2022749 RepID=UPI0025E6FF55|nr:hypothetical protein [Sulfurimonas sp.]